ncbi:MAG: hypothetical protein HZA89_17440 [Verrucomicrobia bacterium]|nr:hypothetical protein [Verrucomicrobiota bacterium]
MWNELDVVRDISRRFDGAGIAFMLTGSMAMNYYAQPRMTRDIDVVVALTAKDIAAVVAAFAPDYYADAAMIECAVTHQSMFNLIHQESVIKVDCIIRKRTDYRLAEFERRRQITIQDFTTWIASKEDLVISKLEWARDSHSELQLRDVRNLLATGGDLEYLEHWTRQLNLTSLLQECRHD